MLENANKKEQTQKICSFLKVLMKLSHKNNNLLKVTEKVFLVV